MSGIFEQQVARIDRLEQVVQQLMGAAGAQAAAPQMQAAAQAQQFAGIQPQPQAGGAFGLVGAQPVQQMQQAAQQAAQQVTPEMIQQLVTPLVANEQAKQLLQQHMAAMGIGNLGDTRPDQMAELYQRFQQVAQQFGAGQAAQQLQPVQQVQAAPSII